MQSISLSQPYSTFAAEKEWQAYADCLSSDGIKWVLSMNLPLLEFHLMPLAENISEFTLFPRLMFLMDLFTSDNPPGFFHDHFRALISEKDIEAASAAAVAGLLAVWDSGRDYHLMEDWFRKIETLIHSSPSDLASASLWGIKGMCLDTGLDSHKEAETALKKAVDLAEKISADALTVFYTSFIAFRCMKKGDHKQMALHLQSCQEQYPPSSQPLFCQITFQNMRGLQTLLGGDTKTAKNIFSELTSMPFFDRLPVNTWLLTQNCLLNAALYNGDLQTVEPLVRLIQHRAVPARNHSNHALVHYNLGLASLMRNEPDKALLHARHAKERLFRAQSPYPCGLNELLEAQSLFDLERHPKAVTLMKDYISKWEELELGLLCMAGLLEMSRFMLSRGDEKNAGQYYKRAVQIWTCDCPMFWVNRPASFIRDLKMRLGQHTGNVKVQTDAAALIHIKTFGKCELKVKDQVIYDRNWGGKCSKRLLKALIAFGGKDVSTKKLASLLWPDSLQDKALNAFRVALHRLRCIGGTDSQTEWQWIIVQKGRISLNATLVTVDAVQFREQLASALHKLDLECLKDALDLCRDDFLKDDTDDAWIIRHRHVLNKEYIDGVLLMAGRCTDEEDIHRIIPYIETAVGKDPYREESYAALMKAYFQSGDKAGAVQVFKRAEAFFRENLNEAPGDVLTSLVEEIRLKRQASK